jgi:hypothetical protein
MQLSKAGLQRFGWWWTAATGAVLVLFISSLYAHERYPDNVALVKVSNNTETLATIMATPYFLVPVAMKETYHRRDRIRSHIQEWLTQFETLLDRIAKIMKRGLFDILWPDIIHSCSVVYDLLIAPFFRLLLDIPCWLVWNALRLLHAAFVCVAAMLAVAWEAVAVLGRQVETLVLQPVSHALHAIATRFQF